MAPPLKTRTSGAVLLGASAVVLLSACEEGQFGLSGRQAEWQRRGEFAVVSASPERAVLSARGQPVAVEPPPGFCLAEDSIETSDRSAVVMIGDCVLEGGAGMMPGLDGALDLPTTMPGIITVSVSGDPGFAARGASAADLTELEKYLASPEGRALLGRGGDGSQVSVADTRREGRILYVLVEDRAAQAMPLLAPRFWRAFVELNDRLAVVTVSGFRDAPMDEGEMLRHLGAQVRQLQLANAAPLEDAPVQFAKAPPASESAASGPRDETAGSTARIEDADVAPGTASPAPEIARAGDDAVSARNAGSVDSLEPEPVRGEEWLALNVQPAEDDPNAASGGPEPVPGWGELTEETAVTADWQSLGDAVPPMPRPAVVASTAAGAQAGWPTPAERPRPDGSLESSPPPPRAAEAWPEASDVPLPPAPSGRPGAPAAATPAR